MNRVYYAPKHAQRAGKHRMTYRRDWMPVWALVAPILGLLLFAAAAVVVMVNA